MGNHRLELLPRETKISSGAKVELLLPLASQGNKHCARDQRPFLQFEIGPLPNIAEEMPKGVATQLIGHWRRAFQPREQLCCEPQPSNQPLFIS